MSKIEVNAIEPQCGTTLTLGASGDTVALASGASQTGFGRTGTVDWITTPKTTGTFTAVSGEGYFCNTSGGVITANLPAGVAGAIVSFADYTRTFQTNNLTITPNGSEKIGGVAANFVASTEGQSITLIYVDATEGWINTAESTGQSGLLPAFVTATGGTITTVCTNFKVHTFTGPGTFTVCSTGNPLGSDTVSYTVVAGGGGGGSEHGGGGGAGGYREGKASTDSYTASPLNAPAGLPVTAQAYPIIVGGGGPGGGPGGANRGTDGSVSTFSSITSTGGGAGGAQGASPPTTRPGGPGGSGGGAGGESTSPQKGLGNTPPTSPAQGFDGGYQSGPPAPGTAGGGGGATALGGNGGTGVPSTNGGIGGAGATTSINGTPTARAGGGGGGPNNGGSSVPGGIGGGGAGGGCSPSVAATTGTINTGGGGGGGTQSYQAGAQGGSGVIVIRYKFQ